MDSSWASPNSSRGSRTNPVNLAALRAGKNDSVTNDSVTDYFGGGVEFGASWAGALAGGALPIYDEGTRTRRNPMVLAEGLLTAEAYRQLPDRGRPTELAIPEW